MTSFMCDNELDEYEGFCLYDCCLSNCSNHTFYSNCLRVCVHDLFQFFAEYNSKLLESSNYITRRQAVKVLVHTTDDMLSCGILQNCFLTFFISEFECSQCFGIY